LIRFNYCTSTLHITFCLSIYGSYSNNLVIDSSCIEKYLSNDQTPANLLKKLTDISNILDPTTNDFSPTNEPTAAPTTEPTAAPTADPSSEPINDYWTPPPIFRVTPPGDRPVLVIPTFTVKPSSSVPSTVAPSSSVPSTITPSNLLTVEPTADPSSTPTADPSSTATADPSSTPTSDLWSPMPVVPVIHSNHDTIPHQVFYKPTIAPSTVAPASSSSLVPSSVTSSSSVPSTISPSDLLSVVPSVAAIGE
jgi:hypothetical protein